MQYRQSVMDDVIDVLNDDGYLTGTIPKKIQNHDYLDYLMWVDAGGVTLPKIEPTPISAKMIGVEFDGKMCSATGSDQSGLMAVFLAHQMQGTSFPDTKFTFQNGTELVLTTTNIPSFISTWIPFRQSFYNAEQ
jgi:hypothetical protein